jgi:glutaredoxin 3
MLEVIIYSKDFCPYCDHAKSLLRAKGVRFTEHNLEGRHDDLMELVAKTNMRTLPQIFIADQFIGGFTDLKKFDDSGELDQLIDQNK